MTDRFLRLADLLEIRSGQRILEAGCGRGAFAEIICDRLVSGRYVGLDRSSKAIVAARQRNERYLATGLATFLEEPLGRVDPEQLGVFDTAVAVNLNLFWTGRATPELTVLRRLLAPGGRLWIAYNYQPIALTESRRLATTIGTRLAQAGYTSEVIDPARVEEAFVLVAQLIEA